MGRKSFTGSWSIVPTQDGTWGHEQRKRASSGGNGEGAGLSKRGSIGFVRGGTHTDIPKVSAFYLYLCIMVFYSRLFIDVQYDYWFSATIW